MHRKFLPGILLASSFAFANSVYAQHETENILPKGFSPEEIQLLQSGGYDFSSSNSRAISTPPAFPVRTMAQWEEMQALVITWTGFPTIQTQMVDAAQEEADVIIICTDSNSVKTTLTNAGVPLVNLDFIEADYNSIWIRDYGAHTV